MIGLGRLQDFSRADFLTSAGLYVLSDRLVLVRLRQHPARAHPLLVPDVAEAALLPDTVERDTFNHP